MRFELFANVGLKVELEGLSVDELGCLARLTPLPSPRLRARSELELRLVRRPVHPDERASRPELTPLFFHGSARVGRATDGALFIVQENAWLEVRGARISGVVDAERALDPHFGRTSLFIALTLALRALGLFHLHAGAVVSPKGRVVVIAGQGGAGKTSLTLALLERGYLYLTDDALFLARGPAGIELFAFPKPFHVSSRTLRFFPRLEPLRGALYTRMPEEKYELDEASAFPGRFRGAAGAPAVVLFPRIDRERATWAAATTEAEGLGALAESSLLLVTPLEGFQEQLAIGVALRGGATLRNVGLGPDFLEAPSAVAEGLVERARPSARALDAGSLRAGT